MRIALFGAGKIGTVLARRAVDAGHEVRVVGSPRQDPLTLGLIVGSMVPGATAVGSDAGADVAAWADVVLLAVPLSRSADLPYAAFEGRVVVDLMNHWEPVDGPIESVLPAADHAAGTSAHVAGRSPGARWVRTLNHLGYHDVEEAARPAGAPDRLAVGVASDDAGARTVAAELVDSLGFDPVELGPLAAGRLLDAGGPVFGTLLTAAGLRALARAEAEAAA
ncbi:NADP oxidoreductase [Xylanimonas oleitrophica]|uniref:NADP oxidoreductase n=1 Tax=Xylanimonas oleitrophica TaxID=2607479 RepID=A0A2W5XRJ8_9MICO|nr:NAD(P)-binding domain-containing protein [Xylanimonas oleitrophica]PZR52298.1 NADP oxidoreductase [Xylanimonas oleitrophica]